MDKKELNLAWMYPDILNLHGERGSVQSFERVAEKMGIKLNVTRINSYQDEIDFEKFDIMLFLPGELKVIEPIKNTLKEKIDAINKYISSNKYMIAVGTTGALFAKKIIKQNGEEFEGLSLLEMTVKERSTVIGDDIYFYAKDTKQEIIGSQIQMIDIELENDCSLGNTIYGYGNDGNGTEGATNKNVIFTNCLGPVFVKNPWWTETILKNAILNKYANIEKTEYDLENKSFETTKRFINEKPKE